MPFREKYIEFVTYRAPSYKEFVQNMELKMQDEEFLNDVIPLLRDGSGQSVPLVAHE